MKKREILFVSHNDHKVTEIRKMLPDHFSLLGLRDIQWSAEIPEPFHTYADNAKAKAYAVFERTGLPCFADDSGLEIDALDGRPGVYSARYSGPNANSKLNIEKVLEELGDTDNRSARFHAAIAFIHAEETKIFAGTVEGTITHTPFGDGGFGYDPIFIPEGFDRTFAELPDDLKNMISHRALAMGKFVEYLQSSLNCLGL